MNVNPRRSTRFAALGAMTIGLAAGSYGIASAASGLGSSATSTTATAAPTAAAVPSAQQPWGGQRSDETVLAGDAAAKVRAAALAKVPGGTVIRVETDADGHALYEAHMTKADGTPVTVYVDAAFQVVSVESGPPGAQPAARPTA